MSIQPASDLVDPAADASTARGPAGRASAIAGTVQLLALLAIWFVLRPYVGIVHDDRYYVLQALHALDPARFAPDLFFRYGSQDDFTLYTRLFAPLVGRFGPETANIVAYAAGQLAWFAALVWLARVLVEGRARLYVVLTVMAADAHYGSRGIFQYAEPFVTPRLFCEALVLCAVALFFGRRTVPAWACIAAAAAIHPLMAVAGAGALVFGTVLQARERPWPIFARRVRPVALVAGAAVVLAAVLGVVLVAGPFRRLLAVFDPLWFDIVRARSGYAFLAQWKVADWAQMVAAFAVLGVAAATLGRLRNILAAVAATAVFGLLADVLFGEIGRNVLFVDLQLWRTLWLATVMANAATVLLALQARPGSAARQALLMAIGIGAVSHAFAVDPFVHLIPLAAGLGAFAYERQSRAPAPRAVEFAVRLAAAGAAGWCLLIGWLSVKAFGADWALRALVACASVALLMILQGRSLPWPPVLAAGAALLAASLLMADVRPPWQKFMEQPGTPGDLQAFVGEGGGLYWEGDPAFVWIKLRRPSFYSCEHGTGAMFYRGTAMDYAKSSALFRSLDTADFGSNGQLFCSPKQDPKAFGPTDGRSVEQVCRASPGLSELVLDHPAPGLTAQVWHAPAAKEIVDSRGRVKIDRFYGYSCSLLR